MTASTTHRLAAAVPLAVLAIVVLGSASAGAKDQAVKIIDFGYSPTSVTLTSGETATWTNTGTRDHTVTADDGGFDSGTLSTGDGFANVFAAAGTYRYHCTIHPTRMSGTVVVRATAKTPISSGSLPPTPPPGTIPPSFFASASPPLASPTPAIESAAATPVASQAPAQSTPTSGAMPALLFLGALIAAAVVVGIVVHARRSAS